jgi:isoleucyl-tRNA synthetase
MVTLLSEFPLTDRPSWQTVIGLAVSDLYRELQSKHAHWITCNLDTIEANFLFRKLSRETGGTRDEILRKRLFQQLDHIRQLCPDFAIDNVLTSSDREFREDLLKWFHFLKEHRLVTIRRQVVPYSAEDGCDVSEFDEQLIVKTVRDYAIHALFDLVKPFRQYPSVALVVYFEQPFTIFSHCGLLVDDVESYVVFKIEEEDRAVITSKTFYESLSKQRSCQLLESLSGRELQGLEYQPLLNYSSRKSFQILVDGDRGRTTSIQSSGIKPLSPAFDQDDYEVCLRQGVIASDSELFVPVDDRMVFTSDVDLFQGRECRFCHRDIAKWLEERGALFSGQEIQRLGPYFLVHDRPLYTRLIEVVNLDLTAIREDWSNHLRGLSELNAGTRDSLLFLLKSHARIPISSKKSWGLALPLEGDWRFNDFLASFNPFLARRVQGDSWLLQFGNVSPARHFQKCFLLQLSLYLTPSDRFLPPQIALNSTVNGLSRLKKWNELRENDVDTVRFGLMTSYYSSSKIDLLSFRDHYRKIVKPLQHNLNFFQQYYQSLPAKTRDCFGNCQEPMTDFEQWVLEQTSELGQFLYRFSRSVGEGQIEQFRQILSKIGDRCVLVIEDLNKCYIRFNRPVLKGQASGERTHRALLTLSQALFNLTVVLRPLFPRATEKIYRQIAPLLGIDAPFSKAGPSALYPPGPGLNPLEKALHLTERAIEIIRSLSAYRDGVNLDPKVPIKRVVCRVAREDVSGLDDWKTIIEEEVNCLEIEFCHQEPRDPLYRRTSIGSMLFWIDPTVDRSGQIRHVVRVIISQIQRLRRECNLKMTDQLTIRISSESDFIREAVSRENRYIERMLLIPVQLVDDLDGQHREYQTQDGSYRLSFQTGNGTSPIAPLAE